MSLYPMPCKIGNVFKIHLFFLGPLFQIHFPRGTFSVWKPDAFCVHQSIPPPLADIPQHGGIQFTSDLAS